MNRLSMCAPVVGVLVAVILLLLLPASHVMAKGTCVADDGLNVLNSALATINVNVLQPQAVDLDITRFSATKSARLGGRKPPKIAIKLSVKNLGTVDGLRDATLTGIQNGLEVYTETIVVNDPLGNGASSFAFGPFTPTVAGEITWTVTVFDDDPDVDVAVRITNVR